MRPGYAPVPEREFSFDENVPGDSHLAIAAPALRSASGSEIKAIKIYATTEEGELVFTGYPNARGFLGRIDAELTAKDLHDAEIKAYRALAPSLSNWAAHLDIPLRIWRTRITELANGTTHISVVSPFDEVSVGTGWRWWVHGT
jgi:hypothetical protein